MNIALMIALGAAIGAPPSSPLAVRRIEKLRPLHIETPLVEGGRPAAMVAASGADAKLAAGLIARVKELSGVALPLADDKQVADDDLRRLNVIVIGNYTGNKIAERLYVRGWTFEDYVYPGIARSEPDRDGPPITGYVVRTVHDPFGFGHNFIVLAGSEPAGTAEAARQFTASLGGKAPLVVPHTVKVRFGTKQLMKPSYSKNEIPQAQVDRLIERLRRTVSRMPRLQDNFWCQTESYAMGYLLTGNACWGRVYKAQMEILAQNLDRFNAMPYNYIEGMHKLVPAWDLMEETPRSCDGYRLGCGHCVRLTQYARRSGDMAYFERGACRQQADLLMMCTDNQGFTVSVGDQDHLDTKIDRNWGLSRWLGEVAWFYRDPSYLWFAQHLGYHELPFEGFTTGQPPPPPQRLLGLNVLPVHENIYGVIRDDERNTVRTFERAPPLTVPREQAFDKLTFREALDPRKQYLLLDGVSGMDHGHIDGNGIARFSDLERMWLVDVGWTRVYPRDHNMLLVIRDGESRGPQKFTWLDVASDLDSAAFTRTTIPGYNGVDWSRHLVWLKGGYVLALDRVVAKAAGDYTLRCRWRSAGEAALEADGLVVSQSGPRFRVLNADGSRSRLRQSVLDDTIGGLRFYPYVNRRGETIVYDNVVERRFAPGESYTFQNLFYASSDQARRDWRIEHVDDSTVRIVSPDGVAVVRIGRDGSLFMMAGSRFWLAQGTSLGQPPLFRADRPVDIECDFATGRATIVAKMPTQIAIAGGPATGIRVPAGRHPLALEPSREAAARLSGMAAGFKPNPRQPTPPSAGQATGLATTWEACASQPTEILDMTMGDLDGDGQPEIVTADIDGGVCALGFDGKLRWRRDGLARANSVAIARFAGTPHVVVGCDQSPYLFVFDAAGTRLEGEWAKLDVAGDSYKGVAAPVRFVAAADMNGDGTDEVLAASRCARETQIGGHCYCYDSAGRMLWQRRPVEHELGAGAAAAMKPGGPKLFFAAGTFGNCGGLDGTGREAFQMFASHRTTVICVADVDGDGNNEVLLGGQDNYVHLHSADGRRRWMHNVGGPAGGIAALKNGTVIRMRAQ